MSSNRIRSNYNNLRDLTKTEGKEKKWDQRFVLYKIPPYDAFKDVNYLSLGLMKSKIRYEQFVQKEKQKKLRGKTPRYTQHLMIDSLAGNKTSKDKKKKILFSATFKKEANENKKNDFAHTYSFKFRGNKYSSEEIKLTDDEMDLIEEFETIKNMWDALGVTKSYQDSFITFLNTLDNIQNIRLYLNLEQKQMQKFKYELTQLLKKIIHRNDQISNLKQLIGIYKNILKEKKSNPEKGNENLDSLSNLNEKQVIEDIHSCLISLRINTINVVNQIKSFLMSNSYFLYMNKINLDKIKNDYYYNDEYLLNIKSDLDFVQHSVLTNLYEFENFEGGDPFFLSFSKLKDEEKEKKEEGQKNKKRKLEINQKILEEIQNCIFFMQQAEILYKSKSANKNVSSKNRVLNFLNYGNNKEENSKKKSYGIGNIFKGNLEQDIIKLKMSKKYDNIFNFIKTNNQNQNKENRTKKSSKKKHNIPLMTSLELQKKLNQYKLLNELINEPQQDNKKEEEFKKRDQEINLDNLPKKEEKKKEPEKENCKGEFEEEENKKTEKEDNDKIESNEVKEDQNNIEQDNKEEKSGEKEEKKEDKEKSVENEEIKSEEQREEKPEEHREENYEDNIEDNKDEKQKEEKKEEKIEPKEEEYQQRHSESKIEEEIDGVNQQIQNENKEEEVVPTYSSLFFTESLDKLSLIYNNYLSTNPTIYTPNAPNKSRDFIIGIYPKIIIAKKEKVDEDKIYGICGINYYIDENKENVLKINHISVCENNKDILTKMIESIEKEIKFKIIEIELVKDNNTREQNNILMEILESKDYKEYLDRDEKIVMRKENDNESINTGEIGSQINYDSLSVLSLINKDNNEMYNMKYVCFNKVINPILLSLLIDKLKINDKYKVEMILTDSPKTSLIKKLSKLENKVFDFIKSQNNDCSNINEVTKNEIISKDGFYYAIMNNVLNIKMNTLMTLNIDNYLYNGIGINIKNNLVKDPKYNNNLYLLPTTNLNVFILIYQYNDEFEPYLNKDNIFNQFTSLFNIVIKNYISEAHNDDDNTNKKVLWIPSFNINTHLFGSDLDMNNQINIINNEDQIMKIDEYNEFLKINYLPDNNKDKNIEMNIINSDNDIIIKDKFLFGICHKEFLESCDIPIIALVNVTKGNFIKYK